MIFDIKIRIAPIMKIVIAIKNKYAPNKIPEENPRIINIRPV